MHSMIKTSLTGKVKYNEYVVRYFAKCSSLDFISLANKQAVDTEVNEMLRDVLQAVLLTSFRVQNTD